MMRNEITDLKRAVGQEVFEKEAVQKTANDLRNMVKRAEGEKVELNRIIQESRQKITSERCNVVQASLDVKFNSSGIAICINVQTFRKRH